MEALEKIAAGFPAEYVHTLLGKADAQQTAEEAFARMGFVPTSEAGKIYCIYETPYGSLHIALLQGKVFSIDGMENVMEKLQKAVEEVADSISQNTVAQAEGPQIQTAAPAQEFHFCANCGQRLPTSFKFCNKCGHTMAPSKSAEVPAAQGSPQPHPTYPKNNQAYSGQLYTQNTQSYTTPYPAIPASAKKLSGGAKAWIIICLVVNAIIGFSLIAISSNTGDSSAYIVLPGLLSFAVVTGYGMLLAKKRAGFYVVCICAFIAMIFNFVAGNILQAIFGILNPVITWLLVRNLWDKTPSVNPIQPVSQPIPGQINPPPQNSYAQPMYVPQSYQQPGMYGIPPFAGNIKNPKTVGMLVWSIVNTVFFFYCITPIIAILQSVKARNTPNPDKIKKHKKIAMILNLSAYAAYALIIAAIIITSSMSPTDHPNLNSFPNSSMSDSSVSGMMPISTVSYTAYENSYTVIGYKIGTDNSGNTTITLYGSGYSILPFRNGSISAPAWCEFNSGGDSYKATAASTSSTSISYEFDTSAVPNKIIVTNGDTDQIIVSIDNVRR